MPFTPFHFGPGALLHAAAPRHVSFLAFCTATVLIDLESLHNLVRGQHPVHAFLHSVTGASLIVAATVALFTLLQALHRRWPLPNLFDWQSLSWPPVLIGAALGAYSHVLLDGIMHADAAPLAPFSTANPLLRLVSVEQLHQGCVLAGLAGLALIAWRQWRRPTTRAVIERHWASANARRWDRFAALLAPGLRYEVPQTREFADGAVGYLELFRTWPGDWRATIRHLVCEGREAVCIIDFVVGDECMTGISRFTLDAAGRITTVVDYWPEPYEPPQRATPHLKRAAP